MARTCVWVVVLGDFGRSPRMQYHTWSLADSGYDVHVLASPGSAPIRPLLDAPNVHLHYLAPPPPWVARLPTLLSLLIKAALQALLMLWTVLVSLPRPKAILMQNPPAIPVMLVVWIASLRHAAALVIDWHNLAYSILALKHGRRRWLIALARGYERALGRRAAAHFCVTEAMRAFLLREFGVDAVVLYDRPPGSFQPLSLGQKHSVLAKLQGQLKAAALGADVLGKQQQKQQDGTPQPAAAAMEAEGAAAASPGVATRSSSSSKAHLQQQGGADGASGGGNSGSSSNRPLAVTPFTCMHADGTVAEVPNRPAIVVSSTSWTPDEDFGILLEAALQYDAAATDWNSNSKSGGPRGFPDVLFVITGRGPQRDEYLARITRLQLRRCAFASAWLEPEDYPALLGCADLGVCLHTSSSGLDLPMKVGWGAGFVVWGELSWNLG